MILKSKYTNNKSYKKGKRTLKGGSKKGLTKLRKVLKKLFKSNKNTSHKQPIVEVNPYNRNDANPYNFTTLGETNVVLPQLPPLPPPRQQTSRARARARARVSEPDYGDTYPNARRLTLNADGFFDTGNFKVPIGYTGYNNTDTSQYNSQHIKANPITFNQIIGRRTHKTNNAENIQQAKIAAYLRSQNQPFKQNTTESYI